MHSTSRRAVRTAKFVPTMRHSERRQQRTKILAVEQRIKKKSLDLMEWSFSSFKKKKSQPSPERVLQIRSRTTVQQTEANRYFLQPTRYEPKSSMGNNRGPTFWSCACKAQVLQVSWVFGYQTGSGSCLIGHASSKGQGLDISILYRLPPPRGSGQVLPVRYYLSGAIS